MAIVGRMNNFMGSTVNRGTVVVQAQLACVGLLVAWGYAFWPVLESMFGTSMHSAMDRHCVVIPVVFLGLLLVKREVFTQAQPTYSQLGLLGLLLLAIAWAFTLVTSEVIWQQFFIVAMVPAIILLSCGIRITRSLLFPLAVWFFVLPVGNIVAPIVHDFILQLLNKTFTVTNVFPNLPDTIDTNNLNNLQGKVDISSIIYGMNYATAFLLCGLVYVYILGINMPRSLITAFMFLFLPCAFLLLGVHLIARLELLTGYQLFNTIGQVGFGWGCIAAGIICSMILGLQLKQPNRRNNQGMRNFSWQPDVVNSNFTWVCITTVAASVLLFAPIVAQNITQVKQLILMLQQFLGHNYWL